MEHRTRRIIYSVICVVLLAVALVLMWQLLGNSAKQITRPYFEEHIGDFVKIKQSIYRVTCEDAKGNKYTFVTMNYQTIEQFVNDSIKAGTANPKLSEGNNYQVVDPNQTS